MSGHSISDSDGLITQLALKKKIQIFLELQFYVSLLEIYRNVTRTESSLPPVWVMLPLPKLVIDFHKPRATEDLGERGCLRERVRETAANSARIGVAQLR